MQQKYKTLEDIADNILGCLEKKKFPQVFLPATDSIRIWIILSDYKEKKRKANGS